MAITKILYLNEAQTGNLAGHLKNALEYIKILKKQRSVFWWAVLTACRRQPSSR